ncbi:MAG: FG-GAP repeat protein, partial [Thermoanaerobaculia bacterium]|nr:FG-GAP repeat protein [Thermoanaerobaculia bacterium]
MSRALDPARFHRVASVLEIPSRHGARSPVLALCFAILAALPAGSSTIRFGEMAEVTASNAGANHQFGWAVAVDGDTMAVGAVNAYGSDWFTGAAYVFTRNQAGADAWGEVVKLVGTDTAMFDYFGHSVAISGDFLVVGAPGSDPSGSSSGAAYVFERNQGGANAWGQVAKLTASDGAETDNFGTSVAIDGATVVVGAKYHTGSAYASGAAYVFARNQGGADAWGQVTKLTASDASSQNAFGHAVAISGSDVAVAANQDKSVYLFARNQGGADAWGEVRILTPGLGSTRGFGNSLALDVDTLAIGGLSSIDSGAVWIHARNQGGLDNWGEVRQLTASDAATADFFGAAVALSGDRLLVGASYNDAAAADAGALFLFERNAGGAENWGEVQRVVASDAASANYFGEAVDLDGATAVAGAYGSDDFGGDSGSAYFFAACKADPGLWLPGLEVQASDGAANDYFGTAVAASGDTLVVGASDDDDLGAASGAAYVLARNLGGADTWGEVTKLHAADGSADDRFGVAVGISGETAVVGANTESTAGLNAGAAYVFARNLGGADTWGQVTKLSAADAAAGDRFGEAIAIAGDLVVVGAPYDANAGSGTGAAYVFARNLGGADAWGEVAKLTASDQASYSFFGQSVAISESFVLVGAPQASVGGALKGAVYLFVRNLGGADAWSEATKLLAVDGAAGDFFGFSVALAGDTAVVGAKSDDDAGSSSGSAYVFSRNQGGVNA